MESEKFVTLLTTTSTGTHFKLDELSPHPVILFPSGPF
jgi:hypothetical protein